MSVLPLQTAVASRQNTVRAKIGYSADVIFKRKPANEQPEKPVVGKGRPTPKRKEREKERLQPLVPDDRKAAKAKAKEQRAKAMSKQRAGMLAGEERFLPAKDRGKPRRWLRDYIDARNNFGDFVIPVTFTLMVISIIFSIPMQNIPFSADIQMAMLLGIYVCLIVSIAEAFYLNVKLRKELAKRFEETEIPARTGFYIFSRLVLLRKWRTPQPQVGRGEYPK